jgi:hypothetical protein
MADEAERATRIRDFWRSVIVFEACDVSLGRFAQPQFARLLPGLPDLSACLLSILNDACRQEHARGRSWALERQIGERARQFADGSVS